METRENYLFWNEKLAQLFNQRQMLDFQSKIEFKPDKLYKGTKGILKHIVFKVFQIETNGIIEIITAKPFEHKMKFGTVELQEMEPRELP